MGVGAPRVSAALRCAVLRLLRSVLRCALQNLPDLYFGPNKVNLGGLLAWEFLMMHFVEVRRWQDIRKHHSVDEVRRLQGREEGQGGRHVPTVEAAGRFKRMPTAQTQGGGGGG
jgi:light-harvesting complex I chlorophyll a/b binding protein 4